MDRKSPRPGNPFEDMPCGIARALDALGDRWTLLVVREAFFGTRRFSDFQQRLGIAKNILAKRLAHLVEHEILERIEAGEHGIRFEYQLTPKGEALLTLLTVMREWSDDWVFGRGNEPLIINERATGKRVPRTEVRNRDGQKLRRRDLKSKPGPGADTATRQRFETARSGGDRG
jgi:DNA-binding HxlR family transcriptional regulator